MHAIPRSQRIRGLILPLITLALAFSFAADVSADSAVSPSGQGPSAPVSWHPRSADRLVLADDFNGPSLDRSHWCTRYQYGGGPPLKTQDPGCGQAGRGTLDFLGDEAQRYVDTLPDGTPTHRVSDGALHLLAVPAPEGSTHRYASAMIRSKQRFRPSATESYLITARLRLPNVKGTWPAFWLAPGVEPDGKTGWPPEIDIAEGMLNPARGDVASKIHMGTQMQNWGGKGTSGKAPLTFAAPGYDPTTRRYDAGSSLRGEWIVVGLEWTQHSACFYLDDRKIACHAYEWKLNDGTEAPPAQLLINLAMGGKMGGEVDDSALPVSSDVDWVRVYRRQEQPAGASAPAR